MFSWCFLLEAYRRTLVVVHKPTLPSAGAPLPWRASAVFGSSTTIDSTFKLARKSTPGVRNEVT
jgi:hypothetical protein